MLQPNRRQVLAGIASLTCLSGRDPLELKAEEALGNKTPAIATNTYPWLTFARRKDRPFELHTDDLLRSIAAAGIVGYEPIISSLQEFEGLGERLKSHGLSMHSIYVNSVLHDSAKVDQSTSEVINIAAIAQQLGTKIVVTNPSPIRWGGQEDKSDAQLRLQARALDSLGGEIRKLGMTLAYHNHDAELRQGAREFHHMLTATDPANVKFCLDAHWVYRGCGNSEVAVFDALEHYHDRVVELHLRQSNGGVWSEAFALDGDINYLRLLKYLRDRSIEPHLVLEQAVEDKSPDTMTVVDAHRQGRRNVQSYF